jgi:hypothetical protein
MVCRFEQSTLETDANSHCVSIAIAGKQPQTEGCYHRERERKNCIERECWRFHFNGACCRHCLRSEWESGLQLRRNCPLLTAAQSPARHLSHFASYPERKGALYKLCQFAAKASVCISPPVKEDLIVGR